MRVVMDGFWPLPGPSLNLLKQVLSAEIVSSGAARPMVSMCGHMPICSPGVDSPQMKAAMAGTDVASGNPGSFNPAQWPAAVSAKDAVIRGREALIKPQHPKAAWHLALNCSPEAWLQTISFRHS